MGGIIHLRIAGSFLVDKKMFGEPDTMSHRVGHNGLEFRYWRHSCPKAVSGLKCA